MSLYKIEVEPKYGENNYFEVQVIVDDHLIVAQLNLSLHDAKRLRDKLDQTIAAAEGDEEESE